ncbi:uncharacterized protein Nmlp_1509 [Natronomonas moolapensis 8.8.11]|uniref:Uncharacterized protein n=1 Tax=Natronomonas moolapensis (strain DSM 18674 / CECT 7526 / JCM 14361 / 8.8.11) TaxID=268739 RepID=M1XZV2_NATM8|nr:uncharacterized protein Nmlp_1509 [Natronomonas moolapensis 8.8.11]
MAERAVDAAPPLDDQTHDDTFADIRSAHTHAVFVTRTSACGAETAGASGYSPPPIAGAGDDPEGFDLLAPFEVVENVTPHLLGEQPVVEKLLCDLLGASSSRVG